jgi:hypothetical protein
MGTPKRLMCCLTFSLTILHVAARNGTVGGPVFNWAVPVNAGAVSGPRSVRPNLMLYLGPHISALCPDRFGRRALTKDETKRIAAKFRQAAGIGPPNLIRASSDVRYCEQTFVSRPSSVAAISPFGTKRTSRHAQPMSAYDQSGHRRLRTTTPLERCQKTRGLVGWTGTF